MKCQLESVSLLCQIPTGTQALNKSLIIMQQNPTRNQGKVFAPIKAANQKQCSNKNKELSIKNNNKNKNNNNNKSSNNHNKK